MSKPLGLSVAEPINNIELGKIIEQINDIDYKKECICMLKNTINVGDVFYYDNIDEFNPHCLYFKPITDCDINIKYVYHWLKMTSIVKDLSKLSHNTITFEYLNIYCYCKNSSCK